MTPVWQRRAVPSEHGLPREPVPAPRTPPRPLHLGGRGQEEREKAWRERAATTHWYCKCGEILNSRLARTHECPTPESAVNTSPATIVNALRERRKAWEEKP